MSAHKLDASTGLTCISCRVIFANGDIQREHYRSDWHRYNLKRKVADLPPITVEQFQQKVLSYRIKTAEEESATPESKRSFCEVCYKQFQSSNTYENHLNSKRHKENQLKFSILPISQKTSKSHYVTTKKIDEEMNGSTKSIDIDMVIRNEKGEEESDDSEGWVTDRGSDNEDEDEEAELDESNAIPITSCLFCSSSSTTVEQNLVHMSRRHGFFLPDAEFCVDAEGMLRYLGLKVGSGNACLFCNENRKRFRSLDACQKHMRDKAHCKVAHEGNAMLEYEDFYDYSSLYKGEDDDDDEANDILIEDGFSLILPSGARIGHRSLMRYYRQHLKPISEEDRKRMQNKTAIKNIIGQYKAIGWTGTTGAVAIQRAKDVRFMRKLASRHFLQLGVGSNKLFKSGGRCGQ